MGTRVRARVTGGALALALALAPQFARAAEAPVTPYPTCDREPTDTDVATAKNAFQAGQASFNEADYARAVWYWEDAYRRDCTAHALLLNLARAYELDGQKQHAVQALRTFNERNPTSPQRDPNERRIEKLEQQMRDASAAPPPPPPPLPGGQAGPGTANLQAAAPGPAAPSGKRSLTPLFVAGAGGIIAIVGGVLYVGAQSDVDSFRSQCQNDKCKSAAITNDANSARSKANMTGVITVGGLAIAAGGIIWYVASKPKPAAAALATPHLSARVSPALAPGFGGLALTGGF